MSAVSDPHFRVNGKVVFKISGFKDQVWDPAGETLLHGAAAARCLAEFTGNGTTLDPHVPYRDGKLVLRNYNPSLRIAIFGVL